MDSLLQIRSQLLQADRSKRFSVKSNVPRPSAARALEFAVSTAPL